MALRTIVAAGAALLALAAWAPVANAQDAAADGETCSFNSSTSDQMDVVLQAYGASVTDYATFCTRLRAANMGVDVAEYFHPQFEETAAVVMLRLYDLTTNVRGQESTMSLTVVPGVDDAAGAEALSNAYNLALQQVADRIDAFTQSVTSENARLAALYSAPIAPVVPEQTEPCQLAYVGTTVMNEAIVRWGGVPQFAGYDALCTGLRARGAGLGFAGGSALNGTTSQAWASVSIYDSATGVLGAATAFAIAATQESAEDQLDDDLNQALGGALAGVAEQQDAVLGALDLVLRSDRRTFAPGT